MHNIYEESCFHVDFHHLHEVNHCTVSQCHQKCCYLILHVWERSTSGPKAHRHTWAESMQASIVLQTLFLCKYVLKNFSSSGFFCLSSVPDSSFVFMDSFLCVKGCCLSHCKGFTAVFHSDWLIWTILRCNIHWQKHKRKSGQMSSGKHFP